MKPMSQKAVTTAQRPWNLCHRKLLQLHIDHETCVTQSCYNCTEIMKPVSHKALTTPHRSWKLCHTKHLQLHRDHEFLSHKALTTALRSWISVTQTPNKPWMSLCVYITYFPYPLPSIRHSVSYYPLTKFWVLVNFVTLQCLDQGQSANVTTASSLNLCLISEPLPHV